jgi:YhcH/YjgK/YiaL family protein
MNRKHVVARCGAAIIAVLALGAQAQGTRQAAPGKQEGVGVKGNLKDWSSTPGIKGLERPFEYLARTDLAALPLGRTDIKGDDVYVMISEGETRAPEQVRFEAHRRYIDIQLVVRGQEAIGVAPVAALTTVEPYDAAKDIEFFAVPQESATLALRAGDFAVFAPGDAHRPSLHLDGPHVSRKAVVKVSVAYRDRQRAAARR